MNQDGDVAGRKPRVLWASVGSVLDTSSGAAISVREMLHQLQRTGHDVSVIGATIFDTDLGLSRLLPVWNQISRLKGQYVDVEDGPIKHKLLVTETTNRMLLKTYEEMQFYNMYLLALEELKPDLVFFYGGYILDFMIPDEARYRGIPTAAYIGNGNYFGTRWARDVDMIVMNSRTNAKLYADNWDFAPHYVGPFVNPESVCAKVHERKTVLAVNPNWAKGGALVAAVALELETTRPDITFEVIESRGQWEPLVREVTARLGAPRDTLANVVIRPHTSDITKIYERARVLMCPSLWWEAFGRVVLEGMINGVPAIYTARGGLPEAAQGSGFCLELPEHFFNAPYRELPERRHVEQMAAWIVRLFDDEDHYRSASTQARETASRAYSLDVSTERLVSAFKPFLDKRAGSTDYKAAMLPAHKLGTVR